MSLLLYDHKGLCLNKGNFRNKLKLHTLGPLENGDKAVDKVFSFKKIETIKKENTTCEYKYVLDIPKDNKGITRSGKYIKFEKKEIFSSNKTAFSSEKNTDSFLLYYEGDHSNPSNFYINNPFELVFSSKEKYGIIIDTTLSERIVTNLTDEELNCVIHQKNKANGILSITFYCKESGNTKLSLSFIEIQK